MSSGNQGRPQDQGRHNGGADRSAREAFQNVGQQSQEGAEQVRHRLREGYESVRGEMGRRYRRAEGLVARNPTPTVLISFGIGFGLGLVVTSLLAEGERERETWADRYVPDRLRRVPGSLQDTLEQLSDSVRNLPEAIGRRLPGALTRR